MNSKFIKGGHFGHLFACLYTNFHTFPQIIFGEGLGEYVGLMGKFVAAFEDAINKQLTAEMNLKNHFPQSYGIFRSEIKKYVGHSTIDDISKTLGKREVTLAYNGGNCLVYELCRHLRNSFCHLLLEISEDMVIVRDKSRGSKLSSDGCLNKDTLIRFIKSVITEYEESFQ